MCRRDFPWLFNEELEKCRTCDSMANYVDHALAEALVYLDEERVGGADDINRGEHGSAGELPNCTGELHLFAGGGRERCCGVRQRGGAVGD